MKSKIFQIFLSTLLVSQANAALWGRGEGLVYDDVLNVTWLNDANFAKTSGSDADGLMTWNEAKEWVTTLEYTAPVSNITYSDWRLPQAHPINGTTWQYKLFAKDGLSDFSYNITSPNSELSYMYYVNLGLKGLFGADGTDQMGLSGVRSANATAVLGEARINNLINGAYWTETDWYMNSNYAVSFSMILGYQGIGEKNTTDRMYAWAVRDGDIAAVPEPGTEVLFLGGAVLLIARRVRIKTTGAHL